MARARLGILLSGSGSTYANLAEACADGRLPAEIAVVVSSRADSGGAQLAQRLGHPLVSTADAAVVTDALRQAHCTWVAMCGWLRPWDPPAEFQGRTVNIHPSLLPAFSGKGMYGANVHAAALRRGVRLSGCTVHLVAGDYDSGPILAQQAVPVAPDDTVDTLQARVQAAERELYPAVLADLMTGRMPIPPLRSHHD